MTDAAWTPLHAQVHQTLRQRQLLKRSGRVLVAVSGGQDSLCLLRILLDLQPKWGWQLGVAHCDHRWRGDAGLADWVTGIVATWGLPFYLKTAASPVAETEAAARAWRYQVLTEVAQAAGYPILVTAHTQSDRAETLLYNLIRGAGTDGLQALTWRRSLAPGVELVRPLLDITRAETAAFCQERSLPVWQDPANDDLTYARNRIRQQLIPYLNTHFHPQVERTLAQTAELLSAEVAYLEGEATRLLARAGWNFAGVKPPDLLPPEAYRLQRQALRNAPLALQRRSLRQFLIETLAIAPTFAQIEKLVYLIDAPNRSRTDPFPGGAIAQVREPWIYLVFPEERDSEDRR